MCNCGSKRQSFSEKYIQKQPQPSYLPPPEREKVLFEYTGKTRLTAMGSITGKMYRFDFPGDQLLIDYRDANGMMAVPHLRKMKNST